MNKEKITITNVKKYIEWLNANIDDKWYGKPWFRGQREREFGDGLLPSLFRKENQNLTYKEFEMTREFRLKALAYYKNVPDTDRIDQWLFLMQHYGLPTRLLDWTESPLVAAFFATKKALENKIEEDAAIFVLDPLHLNEKTLDGYLADGEDKKIFPNTWIQSSVLQTIKFAFGTQNEIVYVDGKPIKYPYLKKPIAIYPSFIDSRIKDQMGCFTLYGEKCDSLEAMFQNTDLRLFKLKIPKENIETFFVELNNLGITYSSIFQDLDGLSRDLKWKYSQK
jgi:hypothetical protein